MAGEHFCLIYDSRSEVDAYLAVYFQNGIKQNLKCIYASDTPLTQIDSVVNVSLGDSYFKHLRFEPNKMIDFINDNILQAKAEGFAGICGAGDMSWLMSGELGADRGIEYEAKLSQLFPDINCSIICLYDRNLFPDEILINIFRTHQKFIYKNKIINSPVFISPDKSISPPSEHLSVAEILGRV